MTCGLTSSHSKLLARSSRLEARPIACQQQGPRHCHPPRHVQVCCSNNFVRVAAHGQTSWVAAAPHQQQLHLSPRALSCQPLLPAHSVALKSRRAAAVSVAAAQEQPVADIAAAGLAASSSAPSSSSSGTPTSQPGSSSPSSSSSSSASSSGSFSSSDEGPGITIKVLSPAELTAVAKLRAEAYYEHDRSRFAVSFKKQFAEQEAESLRQRTAPTTCAQRPQLCDTMVAVDASGSVLGCIDIRLPESSTNMKTVGVPDGDSAGCYLLNVVVSENHRGLGVGKRVMRAAMARAVQHWGAQRLYTHVEADNEVANKLYRGCGFKEHSSEAKYANTSSLGRLVLLVATADDVKQQQQAAPSS